MITAKRYKIIIITTVFVGLSIVLTLLKYIKNRPPNVLLITVDALRADHLGCYGYKRDTSPNIDILANEGTYFLNCFSNSFSTPHSSLTLLSGKYLGILNSYYISLEWYDNIVDKKFTLLAKYLKNLGYYTAAFLTNGNYKPGIGFEQGFDIYKVYKYYIGNAEFITNEAIELLKKQPSNKPFFVWLHYIDVHTPYHSSEEYMKIFENDRYYKEHDKILKLYPEIKLDPALSEGYIPKIEFRDGKYSLNYYVSCYDSAIRYVDFHIGRLLSNVKGDTLIILTADHGESLGEHDVYFHHENLYDETLHIPLIIKDNRYFKGGNRIYKISSSVDIVPTILNRINPLWYFFNKNKFDGIDLKELIKGKYRKYIYAYFWGQASIRSVDTNMKYILYSDGRQKLYKIPDEYNNLINADSLKINSMKEELRISLKKWLNSYPIRADINPKKIPLDEDTKNNLRSLGYIE